MDGKTNATNAMECYAGMATYSVCTNGVCDTTTGSCICNPGYFGAADFVTMDRTASGGVVLDCPTNSVAIRVLSALGLVASLISILGFVRGIKHQCRLYKKNKNRKHWWQHRPLLILAGTNMSILGVVAYSLFRLIQPEAVVGVSAVSTLLFVWLRCTFYFWGGMAQYEAVKISFSGDLFGKSKGQVDAIMKRIRVEYLVMYGLLTFEPLLLVPTLAVIPSASGPVAIHEILYITYFGLLSVEFIAQVIMSKSMIKKVKQFIGVMIENASTDADKAKMQTVLDAQVAHQMQIVKAAGMNVILYALFIAVPQLWSKIGYWLPITNLLFCTMWIKGAKNYQKKKSQKVGAVGTAASTKAGTQMTTKTATTTTTTTTTQGAESMEA